MVRPKDGYRLDPLKEDHLGLYEDRAKRYFSSIRLDEIKKRVDAVGNHKDVVELGCGHGTVIDRIYNPNNAYIGIDINSNSIEIARQRIGERGNVVLKPGDVTKVDLEDKSADIVVCTEVLEHLPDPSLTLREINRILRRDGIFISTVPFEYLLFLARAAILPVRLLQGRGIFVDAHLHYFTLWSYRKFLQDFFEIKEIRHVEYCFRILAVCEKR